MTEHGKQAAGSTDTQAAGAQVKSHAFPPKKGRGEGRFLAWQYPGTHAQAAGPTATTRPSQEPRVPGTPVCAPRWRHHFRCGCLLCTRFLPSGRRWLARLPGSVL